MHLLSLQTALNVDLGAFLSTAGRLGGENRRSTLPPWTTRTGRPGNAVGRAAEMRRAVTATTGVTGGARGHEGESTYWALF